MKKIIINILVLAAVGALVWYGVASLSKTENVVAEKDDEDFTPAYQMVREFSVPSLVKFDISQSGDLYALTKDSLLFDNGSFAMEAEARDVRIFEDKILVLYPTLLKIYDLKGQLINEIDACSDNSEYVAATVLGDKIFVTDAANKNIAVYDTIGTFKKFVTSPDGFVIPSYSFDINSLNDTIYVSNSGRHQVEKYNSEGEYVGKIGSSEDFAGCCNPSYIAFDCHGTLITSEKGMATIKFWNSLEKPVTVLKSRGNKALQIRVYKDLLYTAEGEAVKIYKVREPQDCTGCPAAGGKCPLKTL
ncbi:hypothetical protein BN938_0784 [Mucinivorans hirudinis]|uniref:Periplasmic ATP/GTP-binding protein n=1 Tax=Mucinivorans hirudinis TaxID=1433126 RepID=A0A060RAU5_9BACT|nr:hypothetical protein BN938_0784 [Mucinivorans hirudinis]